jgi:hypothetical protein
VLGVQRSDTDDESDDIMQLIIRQRCLRAANYRYSWRASVVMIVLSVLTYGAMVYEAAKVLDEQAVTHDDQ